MANCSTIGQFMMRYQSMDTWNKTASQCSQSFLFVFSVVTSAPSGSNTQAAGSGSTSTSKIIWFKESFIRYDFASLSAEMVARSEKEKISLQFSTRTPDGVFWMWKDSRGQNFQIGLQVRVH